MSEQSPVVVPDHPITVIVTSPSNPSVVIDEDRVEFLENDEPTDTTVSETRIVGTVTAGPAGPPGPAGPAGAPGEPGPAGGAAEFLIPTPQAVWTLEHDLPFRPNVTVIDSAGTAVIGDVAYPDPQTVVITFGGAFAGTAFLS